MSAPNLATKVAKNYEARIRRAQKLADVHPFASEVLTFYKEIAEFQKTSYIQLSTSKNIKPVVRGSSPFRGDLEIDGLLPRFREFLAMVAANGPAPLATAAEALSASPAEFCTVSLNDYWNSARSDDQSEAMFEQFLSRAFLQPHAEFLAAEATGAEIGASPGSLCPVCGARPLLGVLRPEGDGGKRFLLCSFCQREWEFRRILCPTCGEESETKLPVYVSEQFPYIRVEACDTCKFYLRSIDLTKDGNAVPIVDDLAAIPLSLWASEQGYTRARSNLLGT